MKLRGRVIIAFFIMLFLPLLLLNIASFIVSHFKMVVLQYKYGVELMVTSFIFIMVLTAIILTIWIYSGIVRPLKLLRKSTNEMIEGNMDYSLRAQEPGIFRKKHRNELELFIEDFERMRIKTRDMMKERLQFEENQRELISNISHDLKTPLTAIKGYTEGIMDGVADTKEKQEKYLNTIYQKSNEMIYLVDELSFYSKIDCNTIPYEFRRVNLNDYFMDCISEFALDLEVKNISLSFSNYASQSVEVVADVEKLKRVINNIIGNSQKYMEKDRKDKKINIRIKEKGIFAEVEIQDNGSGIKEDDLDKIFDRFFRSDNSRNSRKRGSGLGLAISRKIIEDHGGKIWAESEKNEGTSIFFTLCKAEDRMVFSSDDIVNTVEEKKEEKAWRRKRKGS